MNKKEVVQSAEPLDKDQYLRLRVVEMIFESGSTTDRQNVQGVAEPIVNYITKGLETKPAEENAKSKE